MAPMLIVWIIAAVIVGAIYFGRRYNRGLLQPLGMLLDERGGEVAGWLHFRLEGHYRGRGAAFTIEPGSKNSPSRFHVDVGCNAPIAFEIYREGTGSRIAKALRLLKDVQIGDPDLDGRFILKCAEPESFAPWLRDPAVRGAVTALFDLREVDRLETREGGIRASTIQFRKADLDTERVRGVLDDIETLVKSVEVGA